MSNTVRFDEQASSAIILRTMQALGMPAHLVQHQIPQVIQAMSQAGFFLAGDLRMPGPSQIWNQMRQVNTHAAAPQAPVSPAPNSYTPMPTGGYAPAPVAATGYASQPPAPPVFAPAPPLAPPMPAPTIPSEQGVPAAPFAAPPPQGPMPTPPSAPGAPSPWNPGPMESGVRSAPPHLVPPSAPVALPQVPPRLTNDMPIPGQNVPLPS